MLRLPINCQRAQLLQGMISRHALNKQQTIRDDGTEREKSRPTYNIFGSEGDACLHFFREKSG